LLPDTPVVTWWPDTVPPIPGQDPIGALAQRRITDAAPAESPRDVLTLLAAGHHPGDTHLARPPAPPARPLLAATLDHPPGEVTDGTVSAEAGNPTADLIAAWLSHAYRVEVSSEPSAGPGITEVSFTTADGEIVITRPDGRVAHLRRPEKPE